MKCPYCEYEYGWCWVNDDYIEVGGEHGEFYELPVEFKRYDRYTSQTRTLYACPSCSKTFIGD